MNTSSIFGDTNQLADSPPVGHERVAFFKIFPSRGIPAAARSEDETEVTQRIEHTREAGARVRCGQVRALRPF